MASVTKFIFAYPLLRFIVLAFLLQVMLSFLQFFAGCLIEGGTNLVGVAVMDCVVPELSGSSHAMATFLAQCK